MLMLMLIFLCFDWRCPPKSSKNLLLLLRFYPEDGGGSKLLRNVGHNLQNNMA